MFQWPQSGILNSEEFSNLSSEQLVNNFSYLRQPRKLEDRCALKSSFDNKSRI